MGTKNFAKRCMQKVRGRVIQHDGPAPVTVDDGNYGVANFE
jgi:hypothetical protein